MVSREGRSVLALTKTDQYRLARKFYPTEEVLEELVLFYRPTLHGGATPSSANPKSESPLGPPAARSLIVIEEEESPASSPVDVKRSHARPVPLCHGSVPVREPTAAKEKHVLVKLCASPVNVRH